MGFDWTLALWLLLTALLAALSALGVLMILQSRRVGVSRPLFQEDVQGTVFLFDGETLVDATPGGRALLATTPVRGAAWHRLMAFLSPRFPGLEARLAQLATEGRFTITCDGGGTGRPLTLEAEWRGGLSRLVLANSDGETPLPILDPLSHRAMEDELAMLRGTLTQAPLLVWRENAAGDVVWANAAYLMLAARQLDPEMELTWPLPRLLTMGAVDRQRLRLDRSGAAPSWFEATAFPGAAGRTVFALPADRLVQAEASLHDFTQTLAKTFAHLPIGLAIFDRQRQLALFNPALLDLTGLPADFLTARPTLFAFLDMMRDRQMIPEPKDYRGWRRQMTDLEKAAASGRYEETWNLPGGQTYRVVGRPHPDGAVALLFEDISTEMSRTRRDRADVELGQSVIDAMDEAVAVFSSVGLLVLANTAYVKLWGHDPQENLGEVGIAVVSAHWRSHTAPSAIWARAEDFVTTLGERQAWSEEARLNDGRLMACRFMPLASGATMASFRLAVPATGQAHRANSARARRRA